MVKIGLRGFDYLGGSAVGVGASESVVARAAVVVVIGRGIRGRVVVVGWRMVGGWVVCRGRVRRRVIRRGVVVA